MWIVSESVSHSPDPHSFPLWSHFVNNESACQKNFVLIWVFECNSLGYIFQDLCMFFLVNIFVNKLQSIWLVYEAGQSTFQIKTE